MRTTSVEAYNKLVRQGGLTPRRAEVYDILFHEGPLTANELKAIMIKRDMGPLVVASAHKRLTELRDDGFVKEVEQRACSVSGQTCIAWDVTTAMTAIELPKPEQPSEIETDFQRGRRHGITECRKLLESERHKIAYNLWLDLSKALEKMEAVSVDHN